MVRRLDRKQEGSLWILNFSDHQWKEMLGSLLDPSWATRCLSSLHTLPVSSSLAIPDLADPTGILEHRVPGGMFLSVCLVIMPKLLIIAHVELFPRPPWNVIFQALDFRGPIAACLVGWRSTPQLQVAGWRVGRCMGVLGGCSAMWSLC